MKKLIFCALSLALAGPGAGLAAPVATSDAGAATLAVMVRHSDLDLTTRHGARLMIKRVDQAAADVCGASSFVSLAYQRAVRKTECYQESMNRALAALGSPTVNALYRAPAVTMAFN